jgi:hypothetical protein
VPKYESALPSRRQISPPDHSDPERENSKGAAHFFDLSRMMNDGSVFEEPRGALGPRIIDKT